MRENDKHFYKNLFVLVLPIAFQNLMSALVSASDAMMLGMVNQDSLSAVSLAAQVQFVLSLFLSLIHIFRIIPYGSILKGNLFHTGKEITNFVYMAGLIPPAVK